MPDPDLEIRVGGGGGGRRSFRPCDKGGGGGGGGGGGVQKGFSALRASVSLLHNRF